MSEPAPIPFPAKPGCCNACGQPPPTPADALPVSKIDRLALELVPTATLLNEVANRFPQIFIFAQDRKAPDYCYHFFKGSRAFAMGEMQSLYARMMVEESKGPKPSIHPPDSPPDNPTNLSEGGGA